jgi:glyoxylase-like metal-dependent hydrolase (beta-lactamase superfamily II)
MRHLPPSAASSALLSLILAVGGGEVHGAGEPVNPAQEVRIAPPSGQSLVPRPWRRSVFLAPQAVSALAISDDGRSIAVATMAFRHDKNFWSMTAEDGKVAFGRYLETWAPSQVTVLPEAKGFAVGLTYGPETVIASPIALFRGETDKVLYAYDRPQLGGRGWLRYGGGDWRTGWAASIPGDLFTRASDSIFASAAPDRNHAPGPAWKYEGGNWLPINLTRPFRMAASADGKVVAFGYAIHDFRGLDPQFVKRFDPASPGMVTVRSVQGAEHVFAKDLWSAGPAVAAPVAQKPPEPTAEFAGLAQDFHMSPLGLVPFRVPASLTVNADGSRVAVIEYGGHVRVGQPHILPTWSPLDPVSLLPRQRGALRVFAAPGTELVAAELPREGLFGVHVDPAAAVVWCAPMSWFARGLAGCPWLPADEDACTVFVYDLARKRWEAWWRFPDAVSDFAVHPDGSRALVSCWDGWLYLVGRDGGLQAKFHVGSPARLRFSADGRFAVAGTQDGVVQKIDREGEVIWRTKLPVAAPPTPIRDSRPVFPEVPVYSVGRLGPEHAYVGDIWLIKAPEGAILVDAGGTSATPATRRLIEAAGIDLEDVRYVLLSHSHGDHAGSAYLWRAYGAKVVAPASAALAVTWLMPTWSSYNLWVPCPIDVPLRLERAGDEVDVTLCGLTIQATFAPGHSPDSVIYSMELAGRRVIFTGDIAFDDRRPESPLGSNILHRCWGDAGLATAVVRVIEEKVLPRNPEFCFTGHSSHRDAAAVWGRILQASREALQAAGQK